MRLRAGLLLASTLLLCRITANAQDAWPKKLTAPDGTIINVYQLQPEKLSGNMLTARAAVSVQEPGKSDPVFGAFWSRDRIWTDRDNRLASLDSVTVTDIRIPADSDVTRLAYFKSVIQSSLPAAAGSLSMDMMLSSLNQDMEQTRQSNNINTTPPIILLASRPSMLVTVDGEPHLQENKNWDVDVVVNTPFTLVKEKDNHFYLLGSGRWYTATAVNGPYTLLTDKPDRHLRKIQDEFRKNDKEPETPDTAVRDIIVTTTPTELLQTNGAPDLAPIQGTDLLYVKNSPDNIFLDTRTQAYYTLLSGRWYTATVLKAGDGWTYVASDKLPGDFAKIPEGSPKDNVLASVAGTDAAREAAMDAQIPQTAKVDRKTATTNVEYDGDPIFEPIPGSQLLYATNTSSTVLRDGSHYYAVDNGVWFVADQPTGPWTVATTRPNDLDAIPPSSPVYNTKFVDIYDVDPDYVYMGYTPGYLNNFLFGPTVVFGTGFYYHPWFGHYYYPRPWSWGFDMVYNPWYGWGFGFDYGFDWLNIGFDWGWGGWYGGWWGPGFYYPACWGRVPYGFYGHGAGAGPRTWVHAHNNLYRERPGITERTGGRPVVGNGSRYTTDRQGNVFQRDEHGAWTSRSGGRANDAELNRQSHMQDRGLQRGNNFQQTRSFATPHFGGFRGGGGGGFRGGRR
jgi:hypothetical protein